MHADLLLSLLLLGCRARSDAETAPVEGAPVQLTDERLVLSGGFADPGVVYFQTYYWMYVNTVGGVDEGTTVYRSADTITWEPAAGVLFPGVATGRAVLMGEELRFFYPGSPDGEEGSAKAILSAISTDGTTFTDEPGVRWRSEEGDAGGPTLLAREDGSWEAWFHVTQPGEEDPAVERGRIGSASSLAGAAWTVDEGWALEADPEVEGVEPEAQVLHPFALERGGLRWMFYNAHAVLYAAVSEDGESWTRLGALGEGADLCAAELQDGVLWAWYGRYADETGGEVWTARLDLDADAARAAVQRGR